MTREPARLVPAALGVLVALVALLAVTAYYPFRWNPPHPVRNDVRRAPDGTLLFGEHNRARTAGPPGWLAAARRTGRLRVDLEVRPSPVQQHVPAPIVVLGSDYWQTDLSVGQNGSTLLVWLRRAGSDGRGEPRYGVRDALPPGRWTAVRVQLAGPQLRILVDGTVRLRERLPPGALRSWPAGRLALGNEIDGGYGWHGAIRRAAVRTGPPAGGPRVDYARAGALAVPARFWYLPDHVAPFPPISSKEWLILGLHLLSFVPVGLLIARARHPPLRALPASLLAGALSVLLAGGKFLFDERHAAAADIIVQYTGAGLGALLGTRLGRGQRRPGLSPDHQPGRHQGRPGRDPDDGRPHDG